MSSRYRFGPLEKRGVLLGLGKLQLATLVVAGYLATRALQALANAAGLLLALGILSLAVLYTVMPFSGGRTLQQWTPVVTRWAVDSLRDRRGWTSQAPLTGRVGTTSAAPMNAPSPLAGVGILAVPVTEGTVGVLHDSACGRYVGAMAVHGNSWALLDNEEKARRIDALASVQRAVARDSGVVARLQFIERTVPDNADEHGRFVREQLAMPRECGPVRNYLRVVDMAGSLTLTHETFVAVAIDAKRSRKAIHQAGGGDQGACTVLVRALAGLNAALADAQIEVRGALGPRRLAEVIRLAYDPDARVALALRADAHPSLAGVSADNGWPAGTQRAWEHYRTAAHAYHAVYWVSELPRVRDGVGPDWLDGLMLRCGARRTISWTLASIPTRDANRLIERASVSETTDDSLRKRWGQRLSMRQRLEADNVSRCEDELAHGHVLYQLSTYLVVTAPTPEELEAACGEVEEKAHQAAGMDLQRLNGEHDVAFTWALPLCRGVR